MSFIPSFPLSPALPCPTRGVESRRTGVGGGAGFCQGGVDRGVGRWQVNSLLSRSWEKAEEGMSPGPGSLVSSPGIAIPRWMTWKKLLTSLIPYQYG